MKKIDKNELTGQIIDIFEDFLTENMEKIINTKEGEVIFSGDDYDSVKEDLEMLFRNWGILEDDPLIDYCFKVYIHGGECGGRISAKAADAESAYQKACDEIEMRLCKAFPELDIEYGIEPVEEEGYPRYRVSSKRNSLNCTVTGRETGDLESAKKIYRDEIASSNSRVWLDIRTSSSAEWSTIQEYSSDQEKDKAKEQRLKKLSQDIEKAMRYIHGEDELEVNYFDSILLHGEYKSGWFACRHSHDSGNSVFMYEFSDEPLITNEEISELGIDINKFLNDCHISHLVNCD